MKCLLCKFNSKNKLEIENHYINFHNVDKENIYFKKLIRRKNDVFVGEKCLKCDEFIPTLEYKNSHDFLKHYEDGKESIADEKPISIIEIGSNIKKYEVNFREHSSFYDFFNSNKVVDDFLLNVRKKIKRSNEYFLIRCGFSIENFQPVSDNYTEPLKDTRYWSTDPIETKSFTDFVYFNIRESILKRVINNGLTGSSWRFNRFVYINVKTFAVNESILKT